MEQQYSTVKDKIRQLLLEKDGDVQSHEWADVKNEAKKAEIDDKQLVKLIAEIERSINWDFIRVQKRKEKEQLLKLEAEAKLHEEKIKSAPEYLDILLQYCFNNGVVESNGLKIVFAKADEMQQDSNALSKKIKSLLDAKKYLPYPSPDIKSQSLRDILVSTNWYCDEIYQKLTMTPPLPPEPFPWKKVTVAIALALSSIALLSYFFIISPYIKDKNAARYYAFADDGVLRSAKIIGVDQNILEVVSYGTELITYQYGSDWCNVKANGKEGYIATRLVLNRSDFLLLNSIFGDPETKMAIQSIKCRRALLEYFKNHSFIGKMDDSLQKETFGTIFDPGNVWQVFSKGKDAKLNTLCYPRVVNPSSKFTDFAVIIKNIQTNKRKFLLFCFADDESPRLFLEQDAPDVGDIASVTMHRVLGNSGVFVKYTNSNL